jgi:hypothetical protein
VKARARVSRSGSLAKPTRRRRFVRFFIHRSTVALVLCSSTRNQGRQPLLVLVSVEPPPFLFFPIDFVHRCSAPPPALFPVPFSVRCEHPMHEVAVRFLLLISVTIFLWFVLHASVSEDTPRMLISDVSLGTLVLFVGIPSGCQ